MEEGGIHVPIAESGPRDRTRAGGGRHPAGGGRGRGLQGAGGVPRAPLFERRRHVLRAPPDGCAEATHARPGAAPESPGAHDRALEPVLHEQRQQGRLQLRLHRLSAERGVGRLVSDQRPIRPRQHERLQRHPLRGQRHRLGMVDRRWPLGAQLRLPAAGRPEHARHAPRGAVGGGTRALYFVRAGGDPVTFIPSGCDSLYAASLAYDVNTVPFGPNGIALYKTTPAALNACGGFDEPTCWPIRSVVAQSDGDVFNDKEWMFVGTQNGVRYVWVTWTEFANDENAPVGYNGAQIKAVRCDENLVTCTPAIPISVPGPSTGHEGQTDLDVQFSDVTVGPDGRAYITWAGIVGELPGENGQPGQPQTFVIRERTETTPGSAVFGPVHTVYEEANAIPFGGVLHANDFRVATYPKSDVTRVNGAPRIFVIWEACTHRFLDTVCEEPQIKLSYSLDPDGETWSAPVVLSNGGDNYFPSISADRTYTTNNLAATWFSNYYDLGFHNAQDVQATSINPLTGQSRGLKRLTGPQSNESE